MHNFIFPHYPHYPHANVDEITKQNPYSLLKNVVL